MSYEHGNYKRVTHAEVLADSKKRDYTIVGLDSMVYRGSGRGLEVLHIVAPHDFYTMDVPVGYQVEILRPIWLYGAEGQLFPLEFIGRLSDEWTDAYDSGLVTDDDDPFPECSDFIWALPNRKYNSNTRSDDSVPWKHVDWNWFDALRDGASVG